MRPIYIAALLAAGVVGGILTHGRYAPLFGSATLNIFIPVLIFEAAWTLDFHIMRRNARPIALLAFPGVILTAGVIALATHFLGLPWRPALVLGAVLSATDPIAVVAIFSQLEVPKDLVTIIESESLLNDAVAVVLFRAVLAGAALIATGGVFLSIVIGLLVAWIASFALRSEIRAPVQAAATLAGAYGVYIASDRLGGSGIFAVLTFGIALREFERHRITVECAEGVRRFWSFLAIAANCVLFFLLGTAVDVTVMGRALPIIAVTAAAVLLSRIAVAYGLLQFARRSVSRAWMGVVRMAGVRGALSVALALSLPATLADRGSLIDATFVVAIVTILLSALTYRRRLAKMDLKPQS